MIDYSKNDWKVNANGFVVLDPHDGYRKDNRLWFGTCSVCGEVVTNSFLNGIWEHQLILEDDGKGSVKFRNVDYCPNKQ